VLMRSRLVFLGEQSGKWIVNVCDQSLTGLLIIALSGQDVLNNTIHVRFVRQHVSSDNRYRLSVEGGYIQREHLMFAQSL
jgi:hypothetical protein